jgi:hypothetical protein
MLKASAHNRRRVFLVPAKLLLASITKQLFGKATLHLALPINACRQHEKAMLFVIERTI